LEKATHGPGLADGGGARSAGASVNGAGRPCGRFASQGSAGLLAAPATPLTPRCGSRTSGNMARYAKCSTTSASGRRQRVCGLSFG